MNQYTKTNSDYSRMKVEYHGLKSMLHHYASMRVNKMNCEIIHDLLTKIHELHDQMIETRRQLKREHFQNVPELKIPDISFDRTELVHLLSVIASELNESEKTYDGPWSLIELLSK